MISGSISVYATSQISACSTATPRTSCRRSCARWRSSARSSRLGAFLVIAFGGKLLLWIFGAVYVSAYPALIVLAAGASIGALAGPAAYVLLLTGHEGAYPRIMACGLLVRLVLIAVLGPWLGLMGAAIAWSVSTIGVRSALIIACRQRIGLDPSLLGVILRPRAAEPQLEGERAVTGKVEDLRAQPDRRAATRDAGPASKRSCWCRRRPKAPARRRSRASSALASRRADTTSTTSSSSAAPRAFDEQPNTFFCARERPADHPLAARAWSAAWCATCATLRPDAVLCFQHYGNLLGTVAARLAGAGAVIANRMSAHVARPGWTRALDLVFGVDRPVRSRRGQLAGGRRRIRLASAPLSRAPGADRSWLRAKAIACSAIEARRRLQASARCAADRERRAPASDKNLAAAIRLLHVHPRLASGAGRPRSRASAAR